MKNIKYIIQVPKITKTITNASPSRKLLTIGDLWLGKNKEDASVLEKVTCNLFLGRNVTSYLKSVTHF